MPVSLGDVRLTFAGTIQVDGTVEYVHPLHNLAVVRYDPRQLGETPIKAVQFAKRLPATGETVHVIGLQGDNRVASQQATVASIGPVGFPLSRTLQFRDANLEILRLVNGPADYDGIIVDKRGDLAALWSSFAYEDGREVVQQNLGVPASLVQDMLEYARGERTLYSAEIEFGLLSLAEARQLGLAEAWIERVTAHNPKRRTVLTVDRLVAGSPAATLLEPGDLLLAVDGKVVNSFADVNDVVRAPEVSLTLWRAGKEQTLPLETVPLSGRDVDRVLVWAGATLQAPHRPMAVQRGIEPHGVFIAFFMYGSPASRYKLWAGRRITEVDGIPVPDLDAFIRAVSGRPDGASLRLKTVSWNDAVDIISLRLDQHYWPAYELRRNETGWKRIASRCPRVIPDAAEIERAVALLNAGELVAFPTETVYGLGADASSAAAVARIFAAKGRPESHPLIVHFSGLAAARAWAADVPEPAARLAEAFWPGPLTLVLPKSALVPAAVTGGQASVALRAPAHPLARALLAAFGRGIAAPSANRYGRISPTRASDVREELGAKVAMVLDGGDCAVGLESTIVACLDGRVTLLRPGSISRSQVVDVVGQLDEPGADAPRAPGRERSHYAPGTPLAIVEAAELRPAVAAALARGPARRRARAQCADDGGRFDLAPHAGGVARLRPRALCGAARAGRRGCGPDTRRGGAGRRRLGRDRRSHYAGGRTRRSGRGCAVSGP